jgi:outer membrane protein TolC
MTNGPIFRRLLPAALTAFAVCACAPARAQISLASAVDLAIRNSPRVKSSEADVARAQALLSQTKDVYIPTLSAGAGIGQAYGYSNYPPTLFTVSSGSLIYNASQFSYIHSARAGVDAAQRSLEDIREVVAEDAALTFVALDRDQQREQVLTQEAGFAARLVSIVQDRIAAGQDTDMDLINARLTAANLHLSLLRTQQDVANDRGHLARLIGVPPGSLRADGGFPSEPIAPAGSSSIGGYANASVAAAFASAHAKQLGAAGDAHFLYHPQLSLLSQFNRYATFTNAWTIIQTQYGSGPDHKLSANEYVFGVQINIPLLDRQRRSKAAETAADATKALHDAEFAQVNALDAQDRLSHSIDLAQAQADVATLEQQRAAEQLKILQLQLASPNSTPVPMTPKDEQNARIAEREKYLAVIEAAFQLHNAQISLLRQTGHLEDWLSHAAPAPPQPPQPQP